MVEKRRGPHLKLADKQTRDRLLAAIRDGVPLSYAGTYAGVGTATMYAALARADDANQRAEAGETLTGDDKVCVEFAEQVRKARADAAVKHVRLVAAAAEGGQLIRSRTLPNGTVEEEYAPIDWRAAKFILQASFRGEFVDSQQVELTGVGGGPVQVASPTAAALVESLEAYRAQLESAQGDVVEGEVVPELGAGTGESA